MRCRVRLWEVPSAFTGESTGDEIDIIEVQLFGLAIFYTHLQTLGLWMSCSFLWIR